METAPQRDVRREFVVAMWALTPKQRQWIRSLPVHGYRRWSAQVALKLSSATVSRWIRRADVQRAMDLQRQLSELNHDISRERIMGEYAAMAFANPKQFIADDGSLKPLAELDPDAAAAVMEFDVDDNGKAIAKKLHAKKPALDALVEMQRLAPKRFEVTGKDGAPLVPESRVDEIEIARRMAFLLARGLAAQQDTQPTGA